MIRTKWQLILIMAVAIGTPLASTLLFYFAPPAQTTNAGEFIEPAPLPAGVLPATDSRDAHWYLMSVAAANCDEKCRLRLCVMHQVRLVNLGESERLDKVWLVADAQTVPETLAMNSACGQDLPAATTVGETVDVLKDVIVVAANAQALAALPQPSRPKSHHDYIYVVDPQGRIMMRYGDDQPVKDIAKDMRRLLRLSQRGG